MARPVTIFTGQWADLPLEEMCQTASRMGYEGLEIASWGQINLEQAAKDMDYVKNLKDTLHKYHLDCWAISAHLPGQCVCDAVEYAYDPRLDGFAPAELAGKPEAIQKWAIQEMKYAAHAAKNMGVDVVTCFMGSPIWKMWYSFPQTSEAQIEQAYQTVKELWTPIFDEFDACGIKLALEVHPTEIAYDYWSTKRLLETIDYRPTLGINFDPSHLIWQGMDPCACIRELGKENAIFHFHAKDTGIDTWNTALNGVLDTTHYGEELERSWIFRTVGYGHGEDYWKNIISQLRMSGYDYVVSIEHEDGLMSGREGLEKAISFLKNVLIYQDRGAMYWA